MPADPHKDLDIVSRLALVLWKGTVEQAEFDDLPTGVQDAYLRWAANALDVSSVVQREIPADLRSDLDLRSPRARLRAPGRVGRDQGHAGQDRLAPPANRAA